MNVVVTPETEKKKYLLINTPLLSEGSGHRVLTLFR